MCTAAQLAPSFCEASSSSTCQLVQTFREEAKILRRSVGFWTLDEEGCSVWLKLDLKGSGIGALLASAALHAELQSAIGCGQRYSLLS